MKKLLLTAALAVIGTVGAQAQVLIAGWDFQTAPGTAAAAAPSSPSVYTANVGAGTLYLDGTHNSSTWITATTGNEVTSFGGTAINAGTGMSTVTSGSSALALVGGTGFSANNKSIVFELAVASPTDLAITYSSQATATGFNLQTWAYSTDAGTTWNSISAFAVRGATASTFASNGVITLPTITGLAAGTIDIRMTVTGASNATGNNRLDNIQFNAVPEPSTFALLGAGLAGLAFLRSRQKNNA